MYRANMESHFVVVFDHELQEWRLDIETTENKFPDGAVWAEDHNGADWIIPTDEALEADIRASQELYDTLDTLNKTRQGRMV